MLGLVVFANNSGLGAQTRRLTYMLKPDRILCINSSGFSKVKEQHMGWYEGFNGYKVDGFPTAHEYSVFMKGLTHVLVCENPLNFVMLDIAKQRNIKVYIQSNYEFCDHLDKQLTLPYKFLMPSYWMVDEMKAKFGDDRVEYLPPPIDVMEFNSAFEKNMEREKNDTKPRLLHIVGTLAANDRNGTLDLLASLQYSHANYELVIRSQQPLPEEYHISDSRVTYIVEDVADAWKMYSDFDALVLPRRYGGLSLTTNEALLSGLPVLMPDISPNRELLPSKWLYPATVKEQMRTRAIINVYESDLQSLSERIDWVASSPLRDEKLKAHDLGYNNFSTTKLAPLYEELWKR